ncbi:hypothetical protein GCM10025868_15730 [Angustibacter aerolatus]|uniref:Uncharacterized protein n=1 Tax=Angustibacter aerolatus TaxID=1162965 RepID=A0ABQ6JDU2_9ACTN|nr:hypothetical protein GCM10025868_15730 [Angustibacter aerolatus]
MRAAPASASLHRGGAVAAERADGVHDQRGDQRPGEREPHVAGRRGDAQERDGADDGEGRALVDAEQPRVGERVAGQALGHRAREPQRDADQQPDDGARHPQVADDDGVGAVGVGVPQGLPDDVERHRPRADGQAQADQHHDEERGERQAEGQRPVRATGPADGGRGLRRGWAGHRRCSSN